MSKYKYTSLLSSQYRQVFKSYHSLDRTEQELKDNLNKSFHKRVQTEVSRIEAANSLIHFLKPQSSPPVQRPESYLYYKNCPKYAASTDTLANRAQPEIYKSAYDRKQLATKNKIRCDNTQNSQQANLIEKSYTYSENERARTNYHTLSGNYRKNELKTKANQINKRRNDIKLNVRVKDIDRINKRYEYLTESSHINQSIHEMNEVPSIALTQNPYINEVQKFSQKSSKFSSKRSPLIEANINRLELVKEKEKASKDQSRRVSDKLNDQQNIQTPHFYQTDIKKGAIEPSLISVKLQSLVKNTFTDRY